MKVFLSPSNQRSNTWALGGTNEKEQAEGFADKLQVLLEKQGVTVVRADGVSPSKRISYAKGCDLYIPLHTNAFNKKVRGCRLYVYKKNKGISAGLAAKNAAAMEVIRNQVDKLGMSRKVIVNYDYANWTELSNAAAVGIPAVYSEAIFHDNTEDCNWYFSNVDRLAQAYAAAICDFLGVEQTKKTLYRVQVGAFEHRVNAETMKQKLQEAGFPGFITEAAV